MEVVKKRRKNWLWHIMRSEERLKESYMENTNYEGTNWHILKEEGK